MSSADSATTPTNPADTDLWSEPHTPKYGTKLQARAHHSSPFTDSNVLHDRLPRGHEHSSACCELVELGEPDLSPGSHGGHDVLEAKLRSGPEGL